MRRTILLAAWCVFPFADQAMAQGTITVGKDGGYDYPTIQAAIDAATTGDTVVVHPGKYFENIHFKGKSIVLRSTEPTSPSAVAATIIDGNRGDSVVTFLGTEGDICVLSGFTIQNGKVPQFHGGGVLGGTTDTSTSALIERNVITSNSASWGGGIAYCSGEIRYNTIAKNVADARGGGLFGCSGSIVGNTIESNSAYNAGGLYQCHGLIEGNAITSNVAEYGGGLAECYGMIRGNTITSNTAVESGGGLYRCGGTIQNNTIVDNSALEGGGLAECVAIVGNRIERNSAMASGSWGGTGGGLHGCYGPIRDNTIAWNTAYGSTAWDGTNGAGGGLYVCHGIIEYNRISDNVATNGWGGDAGAWSGGGGLYRCDGEVKNNVISGNIAGIGAGLLACGGPILGNRISSNSARERGGGLYGCNGSIEDNIITSNSASSGGGLYGCDGVIEGNAILDNSAASGGGICASKGVIRNNVVAGNEGKYGGGLMQCRGAIRSNTIADNQGTYGGGLSRCTGFIENCIIWGNTAETDSQLNECPPPIFSCIENWSGGGAGNISVAPLFVDPDGPDGDPDTAEDNDYRLLLGSPCIDRGKNVFGVRFPVRDLDGNCRLANSTIDIGCYEFGSTSDSDGDLLSDTDENALGSDPDHADTDKDQLPDGIEILRGSNPLSVTLPSVLMVPADAPYIQSAIELSISGDELIVAPGLYLENIQLHGKNIILRSSNPQNRAVVEATILDGGRRGSVVNFEGTEGSSCVLTGFTIQNGGQDLPLRSVHNMVGGGIRGVKYWFDRSHISLACIEGNIITRNAAYTGGGLYSCGGTIRNNTISFNHTYGTDGGGLYGCGGTIENNIITRNSAGHHGGGLSDCYGTIRCNEIKANEAYYGGGGLYRCDGIVENNLIVKNVTRDRGGGLSACKGIIVNNTISQNSARSIGGGLTACPGAVVNCVVWENTPEQVYGCTTPTYSCIQDWTGGGTGNITEAPLFTTGPLGPYYLGQTAAGQAMQSPCVDAGSGTVFQAGLHDRTTRTDERVDRGRVDMGYHYPTPLPAPSAIRGERWTRYR